jgi:hypothetical protein
MEGTLSVSDTEFSIALSVHTGLAHTRVHHHFKLMRFIPWLCKCAKWICIGLPKTKDCTVSVKLEIHRKCLLRVQPSKKFHVFLKFQRSKSAMPVLSIVDLLLCNYKCQAYIFTTKAQKSSSGVFGRPPQPTHKTVNNREATRSSLHYLLTQIHASETLYIWGPKKCT